MIQQKYKTRIIKTSVYIKSCLFKKCLFTYSKSVFSIEKLIQKVFFRVGNISIYNNLGGDTIGNPQLKNTSSRNLGEKRKTTSGKN